MQYLVKMTPLEPYCFGTDQSAPYISAENGGKGTYFIRSKALPEQTTLLGTFSIYFRKEAEFWLYQGDFPVVYNQSGGTYLYQKSFK